jgi:hypothetical protein
MVKFAKVILIIEDVACEVAYVVVLGSLFMVALDG